MAVEFGLNVEGIASLEAYFSGKIIQMKAGELKHIDYTEIFNIPDGLHTPSYSPNIEIFPFGLIDFTKDSNAQGTTGINLMLKHEYRDTDLKIIFTANFQGQDYKIELPIPRGVSLDTSDQTAVKNNIKEHFKDLFTWE